MRCFQSPMAVDTYYSDNSSIYHCTLYTQSNINTTGQLSVHSHYLSKNTQQRLKKARKLLIKLLEITRIDAGYEVVQDASTKKAKKNSTPRSRFRVLLVSIKERDQLSNWNLSSWILNRTPAPPSLLLHLFLFLSPHQ